MKPTMTKLPKKSEWQEMGFTVPPELCSDKPTTTKQTGHTPGPWQAVRVGGDYKRKGEKGMMHRIQSKTASDPRRVDIGVAYYKPEFEEGIANARLIAAAPRMYSFVASKADSGDAEAMQIIKEITNAST